MKNVSQDVLNAQLIFHQVVLKVHVLCVRKILKNGTQVELPMDIVRVSNFYKF